jgi:hypothetical protein
MSYIAPLRARYGTSVEPWHSLSLFYHYDTPLPFKRDYTSPPRRRPIHWASLGQGVYLPGVLSDPRVQMAAIFAAGALTMHLAHRFGVLGMRKNRRRRVKSNGRRLSRSKAAAASRRSRERDRCKRILYAYELRTSRRTSRR